MNHQNWSVIYDRWSCDIYDQLETDTKDAELLLELIGPQKCSIIEIACGSGRILVPLARAGHTVFGIDRDEFMLQNLAQKCVGLPNISWANRDAITGDWNGTYDVVVIGCNFLLNIFSNEDYATAQRLLLQKAHEALRDGGHLFLDFDSVANPEKVYGSSMRQIIFEGTDIRGCSGKMGLTDSSFDPVTRRMEYTRWYELIVPDGTRDIYERREIKRVPLRSEVLNWLTELGFTVETAYDAYDRTPLTEESERTILWLKK